MKFVEAIRRRAKLCKAHPQMVERFLELVGDRTCYAVNGNHWMWQDVGIVARGRGEDGRSLSLIVNGIFKGIDYTVETTITRDLPACGTEEVARQEVFTKVTPPPWHKDFRK